MLLLSSVLLFLLVCTVIIYNINALKTKNLNLRLGKNTMFYTEHNDCVGIERSLLFLLFVFLFDLVGAPYTHTCAYIWYLYIHIHMYVYQYQRKKRLAGVEVWSSHSWHLAIWHSPWKNLHPCSRGSLPKFLSGDWQSSVVFCLVISSDFHTIVNNY